jgi:hypothetical protein
VTTTQVVWLLIAFHLTPALQRDQTITMDAYTTNEACLAQIEWHHKYGNDGLTDPTHWEWNCIKTNVKAPVSN